MPKPWLTTEKLSKPPMPQAGAARATFVHASCACPRCSAHTSRMTDVRVHVKATQTPMQNLRAAASYQRAKLRRDEATFGTLYAESLRMLDRHGFDYLATHGRVIAASVETIHGPRGTFYDGAATREITRDASEAARLSRFDAGGTERLPRREVKESARPTFYPTKDTGQQDGYECAPTWQILGNATQLARHGVIAGAAPKADQFDTARALLDLASLVHDHRASVDELASHVRRLQPVVGIMDQVYSALHTSERRKLSKLLRSNV